MGGIPLPPKQNDAAVAGLHGKLTYGRAGDLERYFENRARNSSR
jgi:hypothetical protein